MSSFRRLFLCILVFLGIGQTTLTAQEQSIKKAKVMAKKFLRKQRIPGMAISVSKNGNLIWSEGLGFSNKKKRTKVEPHKTLFRIASISKSITGVALGKLIDANLINLDNSIYNYLPEYPRQAYDISVRDLASHTAGIRPYNSNSEFTSNQKMSITEGLDLFKNDPILFEPKSQFLYNSYDYVLLSAVMQKVASTEFEHLVDYAILKPLEMTHTFAEQSDTILPYQSSFYKKGILQKPVLSKPVANEYKIAGGGYLSTSEDLIKLGNELIHPKILSEATLHELTTSQKLSNGKPTGYGIGFSVEKNKRGTSRYFHTGGGVGASTLLLVLPEDNLVISILTNLSGVNMMTLGNALEDLFLKEF